MAGHSGCIQNPSVVERLYINWDTRQVYLEGDDGLGVQLNSDTFAKGKNIRVALQSRALEIICKGSNGNGKGVGIGSPAKGPYTGKGGNTPGGKAFVGNASGGKTSGDKTSGGKASGDKASAGNDTATDDPVPEVGDVPFHLSESQQMPEVHYDHLESITE